MDKVIEKNKKSNSYTAAVGRRKEAIARVRILPGAGQMTVNGKPIGEYFKGEIAQKSYQMPFELASMSGQYSATILVYGGGYASQLDAVLHGLSRAIVKIQPDVKPALKKEGLLTRDARVKERRKYGLAQKARAKKQSPKR